MKDKVSVIIPVYNVKSYVEEAIKSVINQTYLNLEIIIIDDGSTDGSEIICDEYKKIDERIILIHQENKGLSAARNKGIEIMTGKYVTFLDSDDAYYNDYIEKMYKSIIKYKTDFVMCNISRIKSTKQLNNCKRKKSLNIVQGLYSRKEALKQLVDKRINNCVWNKLYKSDIWKDISFKEGHVYEDVVVMYKIIQKIKSIYLIDESLVKHRVHNKSITQTLSYNNITDWYNEHNEVERMINNNTPNIFSYLQVNEMYLKKIVTISLMYIRNLRENNNKIVKQTLKKYFIETFKRIDINKISKKNKIKYYLCITTSKLIR